jgi:hypothetical protein
MAATAPDKKESPVPLASSSIHQIGLSLVIA